MPYTDEDWAQAKPKRGLGRPLQNVIEVATRIRLEPRVVEAFNATGDGWQTRTSEA